MRTHAHVPSLLLLSPPSVTFLQRAAAVYADRLSVVYGRHIRFTWRQTYHRSLRLASSLRTLLNVSKNDVVSVLAPNIPALYEMHFAVSMAGAVLNAINTRLDAKSVAMILTHAGAKVFFIDYQFVGLARDALKHMLDAGAPLHQSLGDALFGDALFGDLGGGGDSGWSLCRRSRRWRCGKPSKCSTRTPGSCRRCWRICASSPALARS